MPRKGANDPTPTRRDRARGKRLLPAPLTRPPQKTDVDREYDRILARNPEGNNRSKGSAPEYRPSRRVVVRQRGTRVDRNRLR